MEGGREKEEIFGMDRNEGEICTSAKKMKKNIEREVKVDLKYK
jgi:hypothetical protein